MDKPIYKRIFTQWDGVIFCYDAANEGKHNISRFDSIDELRKFCEDIKQPLPHWVYLGTQLWQKVLLNFCEDYSFYEDDCVGGDYETPPRRLLDVEELKEYLSVNDFGKSACEWVPDFDRILLLNNYDQ